MNKSYREEGERQGRGPGLIGERHEKIHGYEHAGWRAVDKMLNGDHPTTNVATMACASKHMANYADGGSVERHQRRDVEGERGRMKEHHHKKEHHSMHKFAAGGVGKVRKGQY